MKNNFIKIVIALLSIFIFLIVAETLSRLKYNPQKIYYEGLFEYDKDKIYALKKNFRGDYSDKLVITNSYGYRDDEIEIKNDQNKRILVLGDSISFGDGVFVQETFSNQLENLLNNNTEQKFEVINTSVPGNSPFQEYYDFKKGLKFDPSIVIIQLTLNDFTEKYQFTRFGGDNTIDYHNVEDLFFVDQYLKQRSAFYLFYKDLIAKIKFRTFDGSSIKQKAIERDLISSQKLSNENKSSSQYKEAFSWLQKIIDLSKEKDIKVIIIASPYDFQFTLPELELIPQEKIKEFANKNEVEYFDLLHSLKEETRRRIITEESLEKETLFSDLIETHSEDLAKVWDQYFLDYDHYTIKGHQYVANRLLILINNEE